MADKKTKVVYELEPEINEEKVEKEMSKFDKIAKKHMKEFANGYIKLADEVAKYKYPKQTVGKDGITRGVDYSKLQKAQDELISNWNKLSKQGFSSRDDDVINILKSFRAYQNTAKSHYKGDSYKESSDKQLSQIRSTIGKQINMYFTRVLGNVDIGDGHKGMFTGTTSEKLFEKYAKDAVQKYKAAREAGVDLSKDAPLTSEERAKIAEYERKLLKEAMVKKVMAEREYEKKHHKKTQKTEEKALKKIEKQRAEDAKNAVKLPKGKIPEVEFTSTKIEDLSKPKEDTRTDEEKKADKLSDKKFIKGLSQGAPARKFNTPHNDIKLSERTQAWDPTYLNKQFLQKMERGGTYVDTNSLLRQTMAYLPQALKHAMETLVVRIDKDEANQKFNNFDSSERKQWSTMANQTGMSNLLLTNVAKVQGALMRGDKETTPEDLKKAIAVAVSDAVKNGKSEIAAENYNKAVLAIGNMLMSRYDNMKKSIGGTEGDGEQGVGINYEEVATTLKEVFKEFEITGDKLLKQAIKEFPKFYDKDKKEDKPEKTKSLSTFEKVFQQKLEELKDITSKELKTTTNATEKQGRYDRIEYAAERVADSKEGQNNQILKTIEESEVQALETDANTGMNTDKSSQELFSKLDDLSKFMNTMLDALSVLPAAINGKGGKGNKGGRGGNPPTNWGPTDISGEVGGPGSYQSILKKITDSLNNIDVNVGNILQSIVRETGYIPTNLPATIEGQGVKSHDEPFVDKTKTEKLNREFQAREARAKLKMAETESAMELKRKEKEAAEQQAEKEALKIKLEKLISGELPSQISETGYTEQKSEIPKTIFSNLQETIKKAFSQTTSESEVDRIMNMNKSAQEDLLAKRRKEFGIANTTKNVTDTGDITGISRTGHLWRRNKEQSPDTNPFKGIQITPGIDVDYKGITEALQKAIERNQFSAQTGGGFLKQLGGSMTMYLGQDSIEKTRAQADGLNEVMKLMKDAITDLVSAIQVEETALKGMEKSGQAVFNPNGTLSDKSSNEAFITAAKLEELKLGLKGVLAEASLADDIASSANYNVAEILKRLGFVAPELQKCNKVLKNVNSGLDKTGKALKFQKRTQEILNYSYQLMGRHIGQMFKNWMMMLNPLNGIKRLFADFASYNTKWQRTMNVIKYNLRRIVKPMMEWIAQTLVNMLGLVNALMKGIGSVFGKNWDLFDQDAANAEKIHEELEAASNVSAGFDELHDIGSDTGGANDLLGDIYTPQWDGLNKLLEKIGTTIGKIIKAVSDWTFWDWLILAGAALAGFVALKALISWFTGGNPLDTVAKGFKTLQTTVGWAVLITAFSLFTNTLKDFITTIGTMDPWAVVGALTTLAVGFGILVGAIILLSKMVASDWKTLLGMAALVGVFTGLTAVLIPFINALQQVTSEQLISGLVFLAGALLAVTVAVGALAIIFTAIATTGIGLAALGILAGVLAIIALVILAMAEYVRALGEAGGGIKLICEGIATVITAVGEQITNYARTIGAVLVAVIQTVADGIVTVLTPILEFIDGVMDKIFTLATTIAHEIGETIRTVIETTGNVIIGIIDSLINAIPTLLDAILRFIREIGPAVETSVNSIIRTITKLINFMVSGIEYMVNLVVDGINGIISAINSVSEYVGIHIPRVGKVSIPRFVPSYDVGTNYVPNDGLAYLHKGEAVVPKKYNQPYQPGTLSAEEREYMSMMIKTMESLDTTMKQGISVNGQFVQKGSDLVATVEKANNKLSNNILSNRVFAR